MAEAEEITHKKIHSNGIWMHVAEKGSGPVVLLIHGFPQLWSSWNHQIHHLAKHGYRAVAPDMRGYGDSDSPPDAASYTMFHLVGDLIGLLDELQVEKAFVVGHDWGAEVAWHLCLFRPDRVRALVNLGIPYRPRTGNLKPVELMTKLFGDGLYISQFQEPGKAEKSFQKYDCLIILKKFLLINAPDLLVAPPGVDIIDFLETPTSPLAPWISEDELEVSASKFEETGFTGGLNYYRAMDINWELLGGWQGSKIEVPTKLIVGDKDTGYEAFTNKYLNGAELRSYVPDLQVMIIDGHHFIHQEKAELVTSEILSFFGSKQ